MKFYTPVSLGRTSVQVGLSDRTVVLGSCFADSVGSLMAAGGMDVCINPFGTLYNPASILLAAARLEAASGLTDASPDGSRPADAASQNGGGILFDEPDCVEMGAGAGKVCSYFHHTSFARETSAGFLRNANERLLEAAAFWKNSNKLIVTFGTAHVWRLNSGRSVKETDWFEGITKMLDSGLELEKTVSNCLKRPAAEFSRERLSVGQTAGLANAIRTVARGKEVIFTVSPIRHLSGGAHDNNLSKSTLLLGLDEALCGRLPGACYFPSYEILLDELRDYRFYAENDLVHPSPAAVRHVWEKFLASAVPEKDLPAIAANEKASRALAHRKILV